MLDSHCFYAQYFVYNIYYNSRFHSWWHLGFCQTQHSFIINFFHHISCKIDNKSCMTCHIWSELSKTYTVKKKERMTYSIRATVTDLIIWDETMRYFFSWFCSTGHCCMLYSKFYRKGNHKIKSCEDLFPFKYPTKFNCVFPNKFCRVGR